MASHIDLGKTGEDLAAAHLAELGFEILYRNWRTSYYEIDIVAHRNGMLHFVEVKTRSFGHPLVPELNVNRKKVQDLLRAVDAFLRQHQQYRDFRLSILSIQTRGTLPPDFFFIEDVY